MGYLIIKILVLLIYLAAAIMYLLAGLKDAKYKTDYFRSAILASLAFVSFGTLFLNDISLISIPINDQIIACPFYVIVVLWTINQIMFFRKRRKANRKATAKYLLKF